MNKQELTGQLRKEYDEKRGFGITRLDAEGYRNIWFVIPPPPPQIIPKSLPLSAMGKANAVLVSLPLFNEISEIDKLINYFFVRKEAIESSRIEGTWSTIDSLLTPAEVYETELAKSENLSIKGYAHALEKQFQRAFDKKEKVFTEKLICDIHRDIVSKDPNYRFIPGMLRTPGKSGSIVQIGGSFRKEDSTYNPAPPQYVKACLGKALDWLSDEALAQKGDAGASGFTLAVRIAIGHAHFEAVHPFSDGNGRVGRALWPLQMVCAGRLPLYLSGFVEAEKKEYSKALQEAQKKLNYSPMIEFICEALIQSDKEARQTREAITELPQLWRERARFREGSASLLALDVLLKKPILTSSILMEELKVSKQVVSIALQQLEKRQVIRQRGKVGRVQVYAAEELIALLSRKFGDGVKEALKTGYQAMKSR